MGSKSGPGINSVLNKGKSATPPVGKRVGAVTGTGALRKPGTPAAGGNKPATEPRKANSIRSCDTKLAQLILDEIIEGGSAVTWEDVSGQEVGLNYLNPELINIKKCIYLFFYRRLNRPLKRS